MNTQTEILKLEKGLKILLAIDHFKKMRDMQLENWAKFGVHLNKEKVSHRIIIYEMCISRLKKYYTKTIK